MIAADMDRMPMRRSVVVVRRLGAGETRARAPASAMIAPMMAPRSGRRTIARYISAFHQTDVLDRDRAAVAEIDDEDGETDRGFRCRDREYEQREHLADDVAKGSRTRRN